MIAGRKKERKPSLAMHAVHSILITDFEANSKATAIYSHPIRSERTFIYLNEQQRTTTSSSSRSAEQGFRRKGAGI